VMIHFSPNISAQSKKINKRPPNILFAIADDQSYPHSSIYGQKIYHTPAFDRIANNGILFNNAFVAAPQCSPSRAAILTGRQIWQLEEAGTHASYFPNKFPVFTNALESSGYFIGFTGKPWDPGNFIDAGWKRNPVGPEYNRKEFQSVPTSGISKTDYASNFEEFLSQKSADQPFFFWYGSKEPHRVYEEGSGAKSGLDLNGISVPPFLPNTEVVKNDMLDYAFEIEWFDLQLGKMIKLLEAAGELDNTIIVVTADNGMPFPYAKANLQEYGIHVPLAISGPGIIGKNRKVNDLVSLIDLAPTFLDMAGVKHFDGITGKSLVPIFLSNKSGNVDKSRSFILTGRERHSHARPDNLGYPARAIRTQEYLYIENFKTDRWPLGDPASLDKMVITDKTGDMKPILEGYEDIDDSPTKSFMIKNKSNFSKIFKLGFEKRKSEELYDIQKDPYCLNDLSEQMNLSKIKAQLKNQLEISLTNQADPRILGNGDIFDSYPRFGLMRPFEGFKKRGKYNPAYIKK
ncbi:MAG: sulfatase family protein, partial [Sediminibacterium sp.]